LGQPGRPAIDSVAPENSDAALQSFPLFAKLAADLKPA
jgi:hypothetical protein